MLLPYSQNTVPVLKHSWTLCDPHSATPHSQIRTKLVTQVTTCRKLNDNNHGYGRRKAQNFVSGNFGELPDLLSLDEFEEPRQKNDKTIYTSNFVTLRTAQMSQWQVYWRKIDISWLDSLEWQGTCLFSIASRTAIQPNKPLSNSQR
jgi:hypothetical protein